MSMSPIEQGDVAAVVSGTGAGISWLALLQYAQVGFAIVAAVVAIIAGVYAIRVHRRNLRK